MAVYNILPNTNLRAEDIRDTLEDGGANFSNEYDADNYKNNALNYFNSYANINEKSLIKPISHAKLFDITEIDYMEADYGYNIPAYSGYSNLERAIRDGINFQEWTYRLPNGSEQEPFRLGDFRGYQYESTNPLPYSFEDAAYRGYSQVNWGFDINWLRNWAKWKEINVLDLNCGYYIPTRDGRNDFYTLCNGRNGSILIDGIENTKMYISTLFEPNKDYEIYFVITTYLPPKSIALYTPTWVKPDRSDTSSWWVLPTYGKPPKVHILSSPQPQDYLDVRTSNEVTTMRINQWGGSTFSNTSFNITLSLQEGYSFGDAKLLATFTVQNVYTGAGTGVENVIIGNLQSNLFNVNNPASKTINYNNDLNFLGDRERLSVQAEIVITVGARDYKYYQVITCYPQ